MLECCISLSSLKCNDSYVNFLLCLVDTGTRRKPLAEISNSRTHLLEGSNDGLKLMYVHNLDSFINFLRTCVCAFIGED